MANLAEKHDEENSAQLADAEISRVLSVLQKAEFKRSESGNERPDQTFKPRSLMEIAKTARQQDEAAQAAETATADLPSEDTNKQPVQINLDNDGQDADLAAATNTADLAMHSASEPISDTSSEADQANAGASDATSLDALPPHQEASSAGSEMSAIDAGADAVSEHRDGADPALDHKASSAASKSPFETAQAAYDRGYGDGFAAGREAAEAELRPTIEAEFEAKLADKINAFEVALTALAKPQIIDTKALSTSLQAAVVRLAAARTGAEIDQLPELMVARIENLADAAGKNVSAGHVFMHPDDCAVIAPIMERRQDQFKIEPDPGLYRGDIRIKFEGMDISDIAELRADWQISQPKVHANSADFETAQTRTNDVELENLTDNDLTPDSENTPVHSGMISPSLRDGENVKAMIDSAQDDEGVSSPERIELMPLTTTGGNDTTPDKEGGHNKNASSSEEIGLMPLTSTGGGDVASDKGSEDNEGASSSEPIGLMPLTSNKIEE